MIIRQVLIPILFLLLTSSRFGIEAANGTTNDESNIFDNDAPPFDLDTTLRAIYEARESIVNITNVFWEANRTNLGAKFVRLAFHDAIGGMDGCVDLTELDNFGLDIPIEALAPIVTSYATPTTSLSRADIWALASLTALQHSQPPNSTSKPVLPFPLLHIGRIDCDGVGTTCVTTDTTECRYDRGPHRTFPSPNLNTHDLLHFFHTTFTFTPRQTVLIMGAHTIGIATREHSGIHGPVGWVRDPHTFDNGYYRMLIGAGNCVEEYIDDAPNWSQEMRRNGDIELEGGRSMPDRFLWVRPTGNSAETSDASKSLIMMSSDMALVREFDVAKKESRVGCSFKNNNGCPFAKRTGEFMVEYRNDNKAFLSDFRDVFNLMIVHGYDVAPYDEGEVCEQCLRQIDFSITSSPTEKPSMAPSVAPSDEVVTLRAPSGHVDSSMDEPTPMSGGCSSGLATAMARICGVLVVVVVLLA